MSISELTQRTTTNIQEKANLIWAIANELRGSVDGWDFKQYVLGMLFYRYISENITNYINEEQLKAGYPNFDYTAFDDAQAIMDGCAARKKAILDKYLN